MRCFTFQKSSIPSAGIEVGKPKIGPNQGAPCVLVGEEGRGRWSTPVPLGRDLDPEVRTLTEAGATWQRGRGAILVAHTPSDRALLFVPSLMGYRGGASVYAMSIAPRYVPRTDAYSSEPVSPARSVWESGCAAAKLPLVDSLGSAQTFRGQDRPLSVAGVTVLAAGYSADGAAGNMGGCGCFLVVVEPGDGLLVVRTGRLYGSPQTCAARWDGSSWALVDHTGEEASGPVVTL